MCVVCFIKPHPFIVADGVQPFMSATYHPLLTNSQWTIAPSCGSIQWPPHQTELTGSQPSRAALGEICIIDEPPTNPTHNNPHVIVETHFVLSLILSNGGGIAREISAREGSSGSQPRDRRRSTRVINQCGAPGQLCSALSVTCGGVSEAPKR